MEPLWSHVVATGGKRWQMPWAETGREQAETVAVGCDQLPSGRMVRKGSGVRVPQRASTKRLQIRSFCRWRRSPRRPGIGSAQLWRNTARRPKAVAGAGDERVEPVEALAAQRLDDVGVGLPVQRQVVPEALGRLGWREAGVMADRGVRVAQRVEDGVLGPADGIDARAQDAAVPQPLGVGAEVADDRLAL